MPRTAFAVAVTLALLAAGCSSADATAPPVRHVFVVVLENKDYAQVFGEGSQAPYLADELTRRGQLLTQYHGIAHDSLPNYIAMISGQGPNPKTKADCPRFTDFAAAPGLDGDGQAVGSGCVYPARVRTLADQLTAAGLTWKGYMQGMGSPCRHPAIGGADHTHKARVGDQYAARHNPFVYFHSILDGSDCARNDVPLDRLPGDLASASTTPNVSFIVPDLCDDGHDSPCVDGRPGGLVSADAWLRRWIPRILRSAAFKRDGMLVVTFDEAEDDASACCEQPAGSGGGGRTGAVVLSPFVEPASINATPYNHYSLLRTIEDLFGLGHLGYAARPNLKAFGDDVFGRAEAPAPVSGGACAPAPSRGGSARGRGAALRIAPAPGPATSVRLIDARGRTVARRRASSAFTWRPRAGAGVYELRIGARRLAVLRRASRFRVLGPVSARLPCGPLAQASVGRASFTRALRLRYDLRRAARVTIAVRRGARVVWRRTATGVAGTHRLRIPGLKPGRYSVAIASGTRGATLAAVGR